jgi:TolB-like protein/tRNA A-37 threonylcarbamoyl transferase component Bud32
MIGRRLADRYAIERRIGEGAAATVYLAQDLRHDRPVAIKILRPEVAAWLGPDRFLREIRITASIANPHVVPLFDSGEVAGVLYYVMPYAAEGSLRGRMDRGGQLPLLEVLELVSGIAEGLGSAHRRGVIHRDIKPENILFLEGHPAISDFGVAHAMSPPAGVVRTEGGLAFGTPTYMSPEACAGETGIGPAADQYSLACIAYELLAGTPPFLAASPRSLMARHINDGVPPLTTVRPDLTAAVSAIVARGLAKSPADRFPTAHDFAVALRDAAAGHEAVSARSVAVLPLDNLSGLPDDEALCAGIAEEVTSLLARIEGLRVASRTSAFAVKGRGGTPQAIAAQLHVGSVLEGSLRRSGNRLRIAVQLVAGADGYVIWHSRYDRALADVFAIQDEIAHSVATALKVLLGGEGDQPPRRVPTGDVRAYEYYLRGRQYQRRARRKSLEFAREMFERAVALDPHFALAWAGVAEAICYLKMYYPDLPADLEAAEAASLNALREQPMLAEGHTARGFTRWCLKDEAGAITSFETAARLDPRQFEAHYVHARLRFQRGDLAEAARLFELATQAEEDYQARFFAAQSYAALGRQAEAEAAYRRALQVAADHLELNPDDPRAATMRAVSLCRLGNREEGLRWAERARAIDPGDAGVLYNVACLYALEGQPDSALDLLEEAVRAGFGAREWIAHDPDLESLRGLPRFEALRWPGQEAPAETTPG